MEREKILLNIQTIRAAVVGEVFATENMMKYYSNEIDHLCMKTQKVVERKR